MRFRSTQQYTARMIQRLCLIEECQVHSAQRSDMKPFSMEVCQGESVTGWLHCA